MNFVPESIQTLAVVVPANPFVRPDLKEKKHCLAALSIEKLMGWWPGTPHSPHRDPLKVRAIQRSLDWRRVAQIAAYLLQREIMDVPDRIDDYFRDIYEPRKREPGREWPPKVSRVIGFEKSEYPTFANILLHVNGATIVNIKPRSVGAGTSGGRTANLVFNENDEELDFAVIDGQHRVNGAFLALKILKEDAKTTTPLEWDVPAEIFVDLDKKGDPPRRQAQIFIDVNFYQKKVDRSLVADLYPTARGRTALDDKERAQDLGRKLMLEVGPLVGMIQIPGIKYGVKDVVTLATLNQSIEEALPHLSKAGLDGLELQASFLGQCLEAWLNASGRRETSAGRKELDAANVAYQGRVVVSFMTLIPACVWTIKRARVPLISQKALIVLEQWLQSVTKHAGLLDENNSFLSKNEFKEKGFLGSGGLGRFRDVLWAATISTGSIARLSEDAIAKKASANRKTMSAQTDESETEAGD